jgi:tetratricopeptide (TPR) repeat protein
MLSSLLLGCGGMPGVVVMDDPLDKEEHFRLGVLYEADGKLELAEREYLAAGPMPEAQLGLGNVYFQMSEYKKAERCYRRAIKSSNNPSALNNLAFLLLLENRSLDEAAALAERAVEEGVRRNYTEEQIRNFKSTYNQAEAARARLRGGGS